MTDETKQTLELFVEKGRSLQNRSFWKNAVTEGLRLTLHFDTSLSAELIGPEDESLEALALILRFYCQPNEPICLLDVTRNGHQQREQRLLADPGLSQNWKDHHRSARVWLKARLASHGSGRIMLFGERLTLGEVLETFLYGKLAHATKATKYQEWRKTPVFPVLEHIFHGISADIVQVALYMMEVSDLELAGKPVPPASRDSSAATESN